ncbi:MAG: hypothetical protein ACK5IC_09045 [Moheibacter sp.]
MAENNVTITLQSGKGVTIDTENHYLTLDSDTNYFYFDIDDFEQDTTYHIIWRILGSEGANMTKDSYSHTTTQKRNRLSFSGVYRGTIDYLEVYKEGDHPANKPPQGWLVRKVPNPKIVGLEWRAYAGKSPGDEINYKGDTYGFNAQHINDKTIAPGSWVQLHIYTQDMMGKELAINLYDKNFWWFSGESLEVNDELYRIPARNYTHLLTEVKTYLFDANTPLEPNITSWNSPYKDEDKKVEESKLALKICIDENSRNEKVQYMIVQKAILDVFIPPGWENFFKADDINLTPEILCFDELSGDFLEIEHDAPQLNVNLHNGKELYGKPENGISPIIIGEYPTTFMELHPCRYSIINFTNGDSTNPCFDQYKAIDHTVKPIQITAGNKPKRIEFSLPDIQTDDCSFEDKPQDHQEKVIHLAKKGWGMDNFKIETDSSVSWDQTYPFSVEILRHFSLSKLIPMHHQINFDSCRNKRTADIQVFPELEYTFNAHLEVEEDSYLYVKQTKKYHKRDYKAKKKTDAKVAKKAYNKRRKESYLGEVDDKVTGSNFMQKYQINFGMEYRFSGGEPVEIELGSAQKFLDIANSILYVYGLIDSYLFGSTMKAAEEGYTITKNGDVIESDETTKKNNKKKYEKDQKKRKGRKKKGKKQLKKQLKKEQKELDKRFKKETLDASILGDTVGDFIEDLPLRFTIDPPQFTGGVTWSLTQSEKYPTRIGTNYQFVFGALPLLKVEGRLDLLFAAQFIPVVGQAVKAIDKVLEGITKAGDALKLFGVGDMEADYYLDLVCSAALEIDITKGATYHTLDGLTKGNPEVITPLEVSLEAGGIIEIELFELKAEALIHAETSAKFELSWVAEDKDFATFTFEGIEALIYAKFSMEGKGNNEGVKPEQEEPPKPVQILDGFSLQLPLFSFSSQ